VDDRPDSLGTRLGDPPEGLVPLPPQRLVGEETVAGGRATVSDFWRWAFSDLRDNVSRGVLAEWLVGLALGCVDGVRSAWDNADLVWDGVRIEVKSAAHLQAWRTARHSRIVFTGLSGTAWDPEAGWDTARSYRADVYVFAIQTAREHARFDPLDSSQWEFWVAPRAAVEGRGTRSLGLASMKAIAEGPVNFDDLQAAVRKVGPTRT